MSSPSISAVTGLVAARQGPQRQLGRGDGKISAGIGAQAGADLDHLAGPEPESTDGLVGSTVWVWVAAGLVCLGGPVGVGAR